jgi:hypothetical protein
VNKPAEALPCRRLLRVRAERNASNGKEARHRSEGDAAGGTGR